MHMQFTSKNITTGFICSVILGLGLSACQTASNSHETCSSVPTLEMVWKTEGFEMPESVIMSADRSFLYVSSAVGDMESRDRNGYVSKIAPDGQVLDKHWATGMDAPKGMELDGGILYVSDIDQLRAIDTHTGKLVKTIPAPDAKFLNDVVVVPNLGVLVSDSQTKSIFLYNGSTFERWLEDEKLDGINGLTLHGEHVLVATMSKGEILSLNVTNKALTRLGGGMENADGVKVLPDGSYITSSWPGQIWHVSKAGETSLLQDTSAEEIYMNDFELDGTTIYMANLNQGTVQAIEVKFTP